ncbi:MAG: hypothetical protein FJX76_27455, partial [Armatimonadetes bacterium]|nr:hypothetical protein [Armatimonadota bacterium]
MSEMASFPPETAAEHAAVRGAVGLLDVSQAGVVRMTGGDAASVLNGVLTNDTRLAQGAGCLACLLNDVGRVRAAIHLYRTDDALLLEVGGAEAETLREAIDYYIFTEDAVVEDVSARFAILSVQGPLATQTVEEVIGEPPGDLLELHHRAVTLPGRISARLIGHSRTGEPGWDVWVPREAHDIAWEALLAAVTRRGGLPVGPQALEILRVEAGIPALGVDMGEDVNPL